MADDFTGAAAPAPAPARPPAKARGGCLGALGTLTLIAVSALLGAALALGALWYGPASFGLTLPDSTGRLDALERAGRTAEAERSAMAATLRDFADVRGSLDTLRERVGALETQASARNTDLDGLQDQIAANLNTLLALQERLNQLESIPANAALAQRLGDAEVELATVSATLERLRQALGGASLPDGPATALPPQTPTSRPEPATPPVTATAPATARPALTPTPTP